MGTANNKNISYTLKLCAAPCAELISAGEYGRRTAQAAALLAGPREDLVAFLDGLVQSAVDARAFGRARSLRKQVNAVKKALARQFPAHSAPHDQEVIYLDQGQALVLNLRQGRLTGADWAPDAGPDPETFLLARYAQHCPPELILNALPNPAALAARLTEMNGRTITVTLPSAGEEAELLKRRGSTIPTG